TPRWQTLDSFQAPLVRDTAGCGDWCTAGLLSILGVHGQAGLATITERTLIRALKYGQALAAWNCQYEGARGGMYELTQTEFHGQIKRILAGVRSVCGDGAGNRRNSETPLSDICPACETRIPEALHNNHTVYVRSRSKKSSRQSV